MNVVLDTNVLVSAILTPGGKCERIATFALTRYIQTCLDVRLLDEYTEVLLREEFAFRSEKALALLIGLETVGQQVLAPPLAVRLPHASDLPFLEVARAAGAILVTCNLRHFPKSQRAGVTVMSPGDFLELLSRIP